MMLAGFAGLFFDFMFGHWVDGLDLGPCVYRDAGKSFSTEVVHAQWLTNCRIVEYATRDQAQQAIQSLSNQTLMGRLVYVREVWELPCHLTYAISDISPPARTARLNHALPARLLEVILAALPVAVATQVVATAAEAEVEERWEVAVVSSTSLTFVPLSVSVVPIKGAAC